MRARSAVLFALVIAAGSVPPASQAAIDPGHPLLSANTFAANGWIAERLSVKAGDKLTFEAITRLQDSRRNATGFWILREDGSLSGGMQFFGPTAAAIERHVEAGPLDFVADKHYGGSFGNGGMTATSSGCGTASSRSSEWRPPTARSARS